MGGSAGVGDDAAALRDDASPLSVMPTPTIDGAALRGMGDAALVERAKVDPDAFGLLYERYVRAVYAFAFSKVRDQSLAEDVTSQTFLQALRALPRYQERGVPIRSWLFRIASNVVIDLHRSPERARASIDGAANAPDPWADAGGAAPLDPPDPSAEAAIADWEGTQDFLRLLDGVTPEQRQVLRLRFMDQLPLAEVAARTGRSEGAVKMLVLRGLQSVRRLLETSPETYPHARRFAASAARSEARHAG